MNKRIKKLWSQAGGHYDSGNQHTWPQYTIDDPEKFAELIILKCVAICEEYGELGSGETCAGEILLYFGDEK